MTYSQPRFHGLGKINNGDTIPDELALSQNWHERLSRQENGCMVNPRDFDNLAGRAIANTIDSDPRTAALLESLACAERQVAVLTGAPIGVHSETLRVLAEFAFPGEDFHDGGDATVLPFVSLEKSRPQLELPHDLPQYGA